MLEVVNYSNFSLSHYRQAHLSTIISIEFIQNQKILVTASSDNNIILWEVLTLSQLRNLEFHMSAINCVKFGLNRLYSCGGDGKIFYYNSNTSSDQNHSKSKIFYPASLAFSIKLQLIAFGLKSFNLYYLKNEIEMGSVAVEGRISCLSFGNQLLIARLVKEKYF